MVDGQPAGGQVTRLAKLRASLAAHLAYLPEGTREQFLKRATVKLEVAWGLSLSSTLPAVAGKTGESMAN